MGLETAAQRISSLKTYNPKHKWSLRDKLIHEQGKKIYDRATSIACRNNLLESQLRVNYVNEFDRLKGHLYANPKLPAPTRTYYTDRMEQLQELAKQSIHGKDHLYKDNVTDYAKDGVRNSLN